MDLPSSISAFHATPRQFDRFSLEFIGTGLNGESHGRGLYFTTSKKAANYYRRRDAGRAQPWRLYSVSISLAPDEILDEHVAIEKQPCHTRLVNSGIAALLEIDPRFRTGYDVMRALKQLSPETYWGPRYGQHTTDRLMKAGIRAISFVEREDDKFANARGYCVFDAERVSILEELKSSKAVYDRMEPQLQLCGFGL